MSDSVRPHRPQPSRLPRPWDFPGKNTGVGCHFLLQCRKVKSKSEVSQSCPTLRDPVDCSPPGSSVHGIFQARVLGWVPLPDSIYVQINMLYTQRRPLVAQLVKNPPAMQETRVQSLGQEDLLEKKGQPTTEFLPGKSHGERSLEGYSPWPRRVRHDLATKPPHTHRKMLALLPL